MTPFEFVSVLLSLVVSLALAHVLTGMARMLVAKGLNHAGLVARLHLTVASCCDCDLSFRVGGGAGGQAR